MIKKPALTQVEIHELIANRWSGRTYDAAQVVSRAQIVALLEAARWAPSCFGDQPWRFVVVDKNTDQQAWQLAFACLASSNQTWTRNAPVLILVCADTRFNHNQQENRWAQYDTGAAAENLCLQASSMGLVAHQMGGFNSDQARESFAIPVQYTLMSMISIGYAANIADLDSEVLAREVAVRSRRPLGDLFYVNAWGKPVVE